MVASFLSEMKCRFPHHPDIRLSLWFRHSRRQGAKELSLDNPIADCMVRLTKSWVLRVALVSLATVFLLSFLVLNVYCGDFAFGASCEQATSNFSIYITAAIGVIIALLFFALEREQAKLQKGIEFLTELYVARTCMLNLLDVFAGESHKIEPNEKNRQEFLRKLKEHYIQRFDVKQHEVLEIRDLTEAHGQIPEEPPTTPGNCQTCGQPLKIRAQHQQGCDLCKELVVKIKKFLKDNPNPLQ